MSGNQGKLSFTKGNRISKNVNFLKGREALSARSEVRNYRQLVLDIGLNEEELDYLEKYTQEYLEAALALFEQNKEVFLYHLPQYEGNYMVDFTRLKQGVEAIHQIDYEYLFNQDNSSVLKDLQNLGDTEMGLVMASKDFVTEANRTQLFALYETAYLEEWKNMQAHQAEIKTLVLQEFGEDSIENKIFNAEFVQMESNPRIYLDEQKKALLDFVASRSEVRGQEKIMSRTVETNQYANKPVIFVDGATRYEHVQARVRELAVLAASDPKQTVVVYNSDKAAGENNTARSELRELLRSFDLKNVKFIRGSLSQALRPYQYRPNVDLVQYSGDDHEAVLVKKELGADADRLTRFVGEPGALRYGLKYLQAIKLNKLVEDIQQKNGYYLVSPRASESMRLLQERQFVTVFAQAA